MVIRVNYINTLYSLKLTKYSHNPPMVIRVITLYSLKLTKYSHNPPMVIRVIRLFIEVDYCQYLLQITAVIYYIRLL